MSRPLRLEYENAFYHVMNRGKGRQRIFHGVAYYDAFFTSLKEAHERFDAVIHAYCLMNNHYHLLIETPRANLGRIMRHINGLYTQRYNRLKKTDGPLFRGRYKAIVVDKDAYLLQLSRYIHRNPMEIKQPIPLEHYRWSSYLAYINKAKAPTWLYQNLIYAMLAQKNQYKAYYKFVNNETDTSVKHFYDKKTLPAILGDTSFKQKLLSRNTHLSVKPHNAKLCLNDRPNLEIIVSAVAKIFNTTKHTITKRVQGRPQKNIARKFAMYCAQQLGDIPLKEIAQYFGLTHIGSVSNSIVCVKQCLQNGLYSKQYKYLKSSLPLYIIQET